MASLSAAASRLGKAARQASSSSKGSKVGIGLRYGDRP